MPEMTLTAFIAHVAAAAEAERTGRHHALTRAAELVEREAKAVIGHYQDAAPPFAPWAELADATKADRVAHGYPENEPLLREGDMRDSIGHAIGESEAVIGSNSDIAVYQELGTDRIPPRSFLGIAAVHEGERVARILGAGVVKALVGRDVAGGMLPID